jgi:uncharacterized phage-associated protein
MEKYTAFHIANYFLWRAWEEGIEITPLKLIKLVYIAYGWNLVLNNERPILFEEKIETWKYGFVIPSIYHEFKKFGKNQILQNDYAAILDMNTWELDSVPMVDENDKSTLTILSAEWSNYKNNSGEELSNITHGLNGAWDKAYDNGKGVNSVLDDKDIKERALKGINKYLKNN